MAGEEDDVGRIWWECQGETFSIWPMAHLWTMISRRLFNFLMDTALGKHQMPGANKKLILALMGFVFNYQDLYQAGETYVSPPSNFSLEATFWNKPCSMLYLTTDTPRGYFFEDGPWDVSYSTIEIYTKEAEDTTAIFWTLDTTPFGGLRWCHIHHHQGSHTGEFFSTCNT
jgi:hypothetical protein